MILNTFVTCICTADERLNRRKGSRSYIRNQTVAKNLKKPKCFSGFSQQSGCVYNCKNLSFYLIFHPQCIYMLQTSFIFNISYSFILHRYIMNSEHDQLPVGSIAQLVEHCTGITEVMGSNPVQA